MGVLALVTLWTREGLVSSPAENAPEPGFARDMIVHHSQAVSMALMLYDRTENPTLRSIALDIMLSQQSQIGQMQGWLQVWQLPYSGTALPMTWMGTPIDGLMPGMATDEQIMALQATSGVEADRLFIQLMIPHHQGGIHMAESILPMTTIPAVRDLAQSIINAQQREIVELERLAAEIGS
jgi:uncharacterized protein (DUF305 family)